MRAVLAVMIVVSVGCGGRTPLIPGWLEEAAIDGGTGAAGGLDAGGPPVVLASGQTPTAIAVAGDRVASRPTRSTCSGPTVRAS